AYNDTSNLCGLLLGVFIHERNGIGKLFSSRLLVYGGPLLMGNAEEQNHCLDALLFKLVELTKGKAIFIQFRNFFSQDELLPVYEKHGFTLINRLNYIVNIPGKEEALNNISRSRRRQIDRALKNGAEIIEPEDIGQVWDFYKILYTLYRYKIRKPLPDWSFFESFYKLTSGAQNNIVNPGEVIKPSPAPGDLLGIIRLIKYNDRIIGGILAPVFEDRCIYEWYVCGLDREYKDQHPSVLATWSAIQYAIENNIRSFDFMGVGKPDQEYGVRDFKARFGGELVNYGRLIRVNNKSLYQISELGYNILAFFRKI
ncbi:MAG TPA: GNAT family N-acetyltransferase, partial [Bacteroidales bacterium]|nr:GNAT family N-acetyltransferase [Bacteroidales bacterium]